MNKNKTRGILAWSLVGWIASACGINLGQPSKPYRAEVIDYVPAAGNRSESWTVAARELTMLNDLETLQGDYFGVNLGGSINIINSNLGSLVSAQVTPSQNKAKLRYTTKNGTIVPRDTSSLLALSSFYAFEKTLSMLSQTTGYEPQFLKEKISGTFDLYFEPTLVETAAGNRSAYTLKFNAAFNPDNNQFYLFRRSELETVPFSANIKVISHEFGHALFKTSFHQNTSPYCASTSGSETKARREDKFFRERWSLEYAISGLNEGFADFHSYIVTSSTDVFSGQNATITGSSRSLTGQSFTFEQLGNDDACSGKFYCIGTLFARALYAVAAQYSANKSELMAFSRRVYKALEETPKFMRKEPSAEVLPWPTQDVVTCTRRDKPVLVYDGGVTSGFLAAFLQSFSAGQEKKLLCRNFVDLFGSTGFSERARVVCEP